MPIDPEKAKILVEQALRGDPPAQTELVALLTPVIQACVARTLLARRYRLAGGRVIRQDVADLAQDTFVNLFVHDSRALRRWQPDRGLSLENFVCLVAKRQVISFLRNGKRNPSLEEPYPDEGFDVLDLTPWPDDIALSREQYQLLEDRLREELSPEGWQFYDLLFVRELSVQEVQAATGCSADTVYARRNRLRKLIKQLLDEMSGNGSPPRKT